MSKNPPVPAADFLINWKSSQPIQRQVLVDEIVRRARIGDAQNMLILIDELGDKIPEQLDAMRALHSAALRGRERAARELLALGANPLEKTAEGNTALMMAAAADGVDCAKALLEAGGAKLARARNKKGFTALMDAAFWGSLDCVELLLDDASAQETDNEGLTPLMIAAQSGRFRIVQALLKRSDLNAKDRKGWTALRHGANGRDLDLAPLATKENLQAEGKQALFEACAHGNCMALKSLIGLMGEQAVNLKFKGAALFDAAVAKGALGAVQVLEPWCSPAQLSAGAKAALAAGNAKLARELAAMAKSRQEREQMEQAVPAAPKAIRGPASRL